MTGQNSSPYGRGYYGDDDPRYSEPSGTPIPDDVSNPGSPPPTLTPPAPTTTVPAGIPAASNPTSIQQNNKTFHELLFSLFQYNKNLLKTQMEKTKEEISTLTDEIKKNQKMTSFVELLTKLNKLQEEFGDKIEDITKVGGLDYFIDNLEEVNKEMNSLATNTKLLGIGMKKTSYQQELTAAIQRKQEKESSSRMARFFDGMSAGLLNFRKLVNVDEVIEEQKKNVSNAIDTAVSKLSAAVGTRSTGPGGVRYRNVQEFLDAHGITAGTDIPLPPPGEPGGPVDHVGHDRANLLRAARDGALDADQRRALGIAQAPQGANPKTSEYSSDQKDLARRFIMRASFEEGKMTETIQEFLKNSEMVHGVIVETASSSLQSVSDEMKDIFMSFAAGEYEIGMDKEVFGKRLEFLVEKLKGGEFEDIQDALKESQLTGKEREEFIRDTLGYSKHIMIDEQKTKEMVTKELTPEEAQAEAEKYNEKLREASSDEKKKKIREEARARGYEITTQTTGTAKEVLTKRDIEAEQLTASLQTIQNITDENSKRMRLTSFESGLGGEFKIDGNKVVPIVNEEFSNLRQEASRLTEELSALTDEAEKNRKIQEIETQRGSEFGIRDKDVRTEVVKAVITTLDEGTVSDVQRLRRFMKINEEQETSKITARDAEETERKRIERERPEKARIQYGGAEGQIQRDPAVLKAKELQDEKDAILSDLEGDIKNKSERKVFREKMLPLVVDRSITALQFQEKARSARFAAETGLIFSTGMRQAKQRGLGIRENIKQGVIYQAASEAKYQAKASKTDFIKDKISSMTTSALTGGIMNKLLLLVPGIGPALSIGWTVISNTFSALLSVGKFIFGMVGKVFKVLGEVLSKLLELGTKFLKSFVKYGTVALVAWTLLFHFGLKDKIMPMVTGLIKKVAPIIFEFLTTILRYVNEALEGLVVDLNKMLEGGIYDIPRKIFEFFFGQNGVFGEDSGFGALTSELGRLGSNLVQVGGVLLDALKALGVAMYDYFVDIVWPLYLKPAFSSFRDLLQDWAKTNFGGWVMDNVLLPLWDGTNIFLDAVKVLYDFILDVLKSPVWQKVFGMDEEQVNSLYESAGKRIASNLGLTPTEIREMTPEQLRQIGEGMDFSDVRKSTRLIREKEEAETELRSILDKELLFGSSDYFMKESLPSALSISGHTVSAGRMKGVQTQSKAQEDRDKSLIEYLASEAMEKMYAGVIAGAQFQFDYSVVGSIYNSLKEDDTPRGKVIRHLMTPPQNVVDAMNGTLENPDGSLVPGAVRAGIIEGFFGNIEERLRIAEKLADQILRIGKANEARGGIDYALRGISVNSEKGERIEDRTGMTQGGEIVRRLVSSQPDDLANLLAYERTEGGYGAYQRVGLGGGAHVQGVMDRELSSIRAQYRDATPKQKTKLKREIQNNPNSVYSFDSNDQIVFSSGFQGKYEGGTTVGDRPIPEDLKKMGYTISNEGYISNAVGTRDQDQKKNILDYIGSAESPDNPLSPEQLEERKRRIELVREIGLHEYDAENNEVRPVPAREQGDRGPTIDEVMKDNDLFTPEDVAKQGEYTAAYVADQASTISQVNQENNRLEHAIRENTEATRQNSRAMAPKPKTSGRAKTLLDVFFGDLFKAKNPFRLTKNSGPAFGGINDKNAYFDGVVGDEPAFGGVMSGGSIFGDSDVVSRGLNISKSLSTPQSSGGTTVFNIGSNNVSSTQVDNNTSANASLDNHGALAYSTIPQFGYGFA